VPGGRWRSSGPEGFTDAFARGRPILELRPRYNHIEESDKPLTTEGGTIRIVAGWRSAPWRDLRFTIEGIHADRIGPQRFNDDGGLINISPYPLLPDPQPPTSTRPSSSTRACRRRASWQAASACAWTTSDG
jgi:hypothetical protein